MAWTEQCKVAFHANATAKLGRFKNKNRKLYGVLRELSKESGIPFNTLKGWWYDQAGSQEEKSIRIINDTYKPPIDKICDRCGKETVYLHHRTRQPLSEESKYFGLCGKCRTNQQYIEKIDRTADAENGIMTVCPYCEKVHYVFDESKYNRKRGEYGKA